MSTCPVTCQMYQRLLLNLIEVATLVLFVFCPKYHLARLHMMFLRPLETLYNVTKSLLSNFAQNKIQLETVVDYVISLLIIICKMLDSYYYFFFVLVLYYFFICFVSINKQTNTHTHIPSHTHVYVCIFATLLTFLNKHSRLNVGILMQELVGF